MQRQMGRTICVASIALTCLLVQAAASAQFTKIHDFGSGNEGTGPGGGSGMSRVGSTFFGPTTFGSSAYVPGTVFSMDPSGNVKTLHNFGGAGDGNWGDATSSLIYYGGWLYGNTNDTSGVGGGGANNHGVIFRMKPDGSRYKVIFNAPASGPLEISGILNGVIYGCVEYGGASGDGAIFRMNLDGSGFADLHEFDGSDGNTVGYPPLLVAGSRYTTPLLVGTAMFGGVSNDGVIYRMNLDGSGFAVLHEFAGTDGSLPTGPLLLNNGVLYSTAQQSGAFGQGTIWKLDGTGFTVLHDFSGTEGIQPNGVLLYHGTLYGTTGYGGTSNGGAIFSIWPNGANFTVLQQLDATTGYHCQGLTLYNNLLYGVASVGGLYGGGTAFTIVPH